MTVALSLQIYANMGGGSSGLSSLTLSLHVFCTVIISAACSSVSLELEGWVHISLCSSSLDFFFLFHLCCQLETRCSDAANWDIPSVVYSGGDATEDPHSHTRSRFPHAARDYSQSWCCIAGSRCALRTLHFDRV